MPCVAGVSGTCNVTTSLCAKQLMQARDRLGIAVAKLVGVVVEDDLHAERFGEIGQLRADIAVADDAERLAPHLVAVVGGLVPAALMGGIGTRDDPAQQDDDLADHQFRHAARVGKRRVEHRNPARRAASTSTWLVPTLKHPIAISRSAASRTSGVICVRERMPRMMHALDGLLQRIALERLGQTRHAGIAGSLDQLHGAVVDAFEEQDLDLVLGERELGKRSFTGQDRSVLQG